MVMRNFREKAKLPEKRAQLLILATELSSTGGKSTGKQTEYELLEKEIEQLENEMEDRVEQAKEKWSTIITARDVLMDPISKKLYDMNNFKKCTYEEHEELQLMYQKAANLYCENNKTKYFKNLDARGREGLVIVDARYGDLKSTMEESPGCYIDVKIPLQVMVGEMEDNVLDYMPPHTFTSYSFMPGFYDPVWVFNEEDEEDKTLEIVYRYAGRLHSATFEDGERIVIPAEDHLCDQDVTIEDLGWRRLVRERTVELLEEARVKAIRRTIALLLMGGLGFLAYMFSGAIRGRTTKKD